MKNEEDGEGESRRRSRDEDREGKGRGESMELVQFPHDGSPHILGEITLITRLFRVVFYGDHSGAILHFFISPKKR